MRRYYYTYEIANAIHERWGLVGSLIAVFICIALLLLIELLQYYRWEIKRFLKKILKKYKS